MYYNKQAELFQPVENSDSSQNSGSDRYNQNQLIGQLHLIFTLEIMVAAQVYGSIEWDTIPN